MMRDPTGETFGDVLHQLRRGAAEQQVSRGLLAIRKDAEKWKEIRLALHFVDHDGAGQALQGSLRFVQSGQASRIFEVEEMLGLQGLSQRGLATLPGTEECRDGRTVELGSNNLQLPRTRQITHGKTVAWKT